MAVYFDGVTCTGETEKAILVDIPDILEPVWVPQSQVEDDSEVYAKNHCGRLAVSDWIAEQKGWL